MALEAQSIFWIVFFSIMLANIAHDMVVCVQQPMFTEMFGASYRYSGAGVGYQVASVVGGGFTPFIAAALITYFAGNWHSVAIYLLAGCLISAMTALLMKTVNALDSLAKIIRSSPYTFVSHFCDILSDVR